jgi:hypothetical protein
VKERKMKKLMFALCVLLALVSGGSGSAKADPECYPFTGFVYLEAETTHYTMEIEVEGCTEDFQSFPAHRR